jgi:predicted Zn finger-like uncharacterized protein
MKIACQACQAKYTIADEKVLGKIVKIRCKKCGATIVINGNEDANAGGGQQAYDYAQQGGEPWTVNVADGDQRTMTTHEIVDAFQQGVVNDETYCWKDGMADWLPLRDIPEIFSLVGAQPAPVDMSLRSMAADEEATQMAQAPVGSPAAGGAGFGSLFGSSNGGGGALFGGGEAPAASPSGPSAAAAAAARRQGGRGAAGADLFGGVAAAGGEDDVMTSAAAQPGAGSSKMTGERNENSVLFSLSALTENAPKEAAGGPPAAEGSGLIDIRALSANMASSDNKSGRHVDDIMNLGGGGAFSAALAAPVLAPPPADMSELSGERKKSNMGMIVGLGIAAIVIVGGAVSAAAYFALKKDTTGTQPTTTVATNSPTNTAPTNTGTALAMNDTATTPSSTAAPPGTGVGTGGGGVKPPNTGGGGVKPPNTGGGVNTTVAPPPPPPNTGGGGGCCPGESPMQCEMRKSSGAPCPAAATTTGGGGTSAPFDRGAAAGALGAVNLSSCKKADGPSGSGHVKVTFEPNGTVSKVDVDQPPFSGTPVGGCVAGKYRGVKIPAFSGGSMTVGKSFSLN